MRRCFLAPRSCRKGFAFERCTALAVLTADPAKSLRETEIVHEAVGDRLPQLTHLGLAYAYAGKTDSARMILHRLLERSKT